MKYLKNFNESKVSELYHNVIELRKFCKDYLAYLIDVGFDINVSNSAHGREYYSTISIYSNKENFNFKDIENDFIPFIILLNKKYRLFNNFIGPDSIPVKIKEGANISINFEDTKGKSWESWQHFTVDEIVNNFNIDKEIRCIYIKIKNEE